MTEILGLIGFEGYKIRCLIGTEPHERIYEQEIKVDLKVEADISNASISDHIEDTINYVNLAKICEELARNNSFHLLEKYAVEVLKDVLANFNVKRAWIRVTKPSALKAADHAFVELQLNRQQ